VSGRALADLEALYAEIENWEAAAPGGYGWGHGARMNRVTRRRPYLCVSSVPVSADIDTAAGAAVTWRGERILTAPSKDLLPGAEPGRYDAKLEILVALDDTLGRAAFLSHEDEASTLGGTGTPKTAVISCTVWGVPNRVDALRTEMIEAYQDRDALIGNTQAVKWLIDTTIGEETERFEVDHVRQYFNDLTDQIYRGTALWFARDTEAIDACAEAMTDKGLAPILGTSRLVRGLALLGLATMMNPERDAVADLFERRGLNLDETLDHLRGCWERHGYPPRVRESGNELYCVI
jgi:hypothetical protein